MRNKSINIFILIFIVPLVLALTENNVNFGSKGAFSTGGLNSTKALSTGDSNTNKAPAFPPSGAISAPNNSVVNPSTSILKASSNNANSYIMKNWRKIKKMSLTQLKKLPRNVRNHHKIKRLIKKKKKTLAKSKSKKKQSKNKSMAKSSAPKTNPSSKGGAPTTSQSSKTPGGSTTTDSSTSPSTTSAGTSGGLGGSGKSGKSNATSDAEDAIKAAAAKGGTVATGGIEEHHDGDSAAKAPTSNLDVISSSQTESSKASPQMQQNSISCEMRLIQQRGMTRSCCEQLRAQYEASILDPVQEEELRNNDLEDVGRIAKLVGSSKIGQLNSYLSNINFRVSNGKFSVIENFKRLGKMGKLINEAYGESKYNAFRNRMLAAWRSNSISSEMGSERQKVFKDLNDAIEIIRNNGSGELTRANRPAVSQNDNSQGPIIPGQEQNRNENQFAYLWKQSCTE